MRWSKIDTKWTQRILQLICDICEIYKYNAYDLLYLVVSQNWASLFLIEYGL